MYVDHFKAYQIYFGEVVERMEQWEKQWNEARILNMMDIALDTKDFEWFMELQEEMRS